MMVENGIASRRSALSAEKQALLEQRLRGALTTPPKRRTIPRRPDAGNAPLSFAQQQLWFLDQLAPNSALYNISSAVRLSGRLDREALARSLAAIVARHEPLRTRFVASDGSPVQVIDGPKPVKLPFLDLSATPAALDETEAQRILREEAQRPFDLARDPMMRTALLKLGEAEHILSVTAHHIAADGWSLGIFFRELAVCYEAFSTGRKPALPELPIQFADFAAWQREWMQADVYETQLAFWKERLAGAPTFLELPADKPRPPVQSFCGVSRSLTLLPEFSERLKTLSRQEGVTLFMLSLAVLKTQIHRYTQQTDILVGMPVAGRNQIETEGLIGFFVNSVVLRVDFSGNPSFRELLSRVRRATLDALAHQDLPFEKLVEELRLERSLGHNPLFQVMCAPQSAPMRSAGMSGLTLTPVDVGTGTAKFDLTLGIEEREAGLQVTLEGNADLFEPPTVERMLGHFRALLESVAVNPEQSISQLRLLTVPERHQLLVEWNDTRAHYPRDKTIAQLFEEQAAKSPEIVAVACAGQQLTYRELNERANQLAHYLQKLGIRSEALVAVCLERSLELIVALLGILKAGGAYVSLDPAYPSERLAFMLADLRAPVLLTQEKLRAAFPDRMAGASHDSQIAPHPSPVANPISSCLDTGWTTIGREALTNPVSPDQLGAESLAYVSFTSGSTGRPKGVCVPQRGVVRLVKETNYARFDAGEVFLQLAPVAFDASTLEIWGPLLNGARLVVFPPHTPSLAELGEFIEKHRISTLWLTAGLFNQMIEEQSHHLKGLRQLLAGGDVLSVAHVAMALEKLPGCRLINGYGPTENTTFTCCHHITAPLEANRSIPIGQPIANTQVFILDENLQPMPVGVPGELHIGGDGLARGYLNAPELTAEKFIRNPFSVGVQASACPASAGDTLMRELQPDALLYRTGDLARWRPDGTIEFLGRRDTQTKIRGFRVELGEVETVLSQHPAVRECVVATHPDASGGKQLAAYFVPHMSATPTADQLRQYLREKLPEYMVPAWFAKLESLPLNANGKVDRRALPAPDQLAADSRRKFVAPRDAREAQLAKIWEDVLGIQPIGVEDHFFDVGGHSLLAVRLVARMEKTFERKIPVAAVFQSPTIAQLARFLGGEKETAASSSLVEIQPRGAKPPLFLVHGVGGGMLWGYTNLSRQLGPEQPVYAFKSRAMDGAEEFGSIEAMAAQYVADLRAFQPRGPYHLGGYCFGGNVAYEMARHLQAQGERVALLALMNCAPPNSGYDRFRFTPAWALRFLRNLGYWAGYFIRRDPQQRREFLQWKLRAIRSAAQRLLTRSRSGPDRFRVEELVDLSARTDAERKLWEAHIRALLNFTPKPYSGRVTLFRSRGHQLLCSFDPQYGWGQLAAGGVAVKIVPGAHESILEETHVKALAVELKNLLEEIHQRNGETPL